jgi:hypothetical protein
MWNLLTYDLLSKIHEEYPYTFKYNQNTSKVITRFGVGNIYTMQLGSCNLCPN